ncbi:hypothetical protein OIE43_42870 [Streptomyces pseudovenezuelae]
MDGPDHLLGATLSILGDDHVGPGTMNSGPLYRAVTDQARALMRMGRTGRAEAGPVVDQRSDPLAGRESTSRHAVSRALSGHRDRLPRGGRSGSHRTSTSRAVAPGYALGAHCGRGADPPAPVGRMNRGGGKVDSAPAYHSEQDSPPTCGDGAPIPSSTAPHSAFPAAPYGGRPRATQACRSAHQGARGDEGRPSQARTNTRTLKPPHRRPWFLAVRPDGRRT